ncbi:MAG: hypothetical protein IPO05_18250 [Flavobacteriales bacterium]|nr:hypothetical protein [Flavobacteriales bacterium]
MTRNADHGTGSRAGVRVGHSNGAITRTAHITGAHRLSRNPDITPTSCRTLRGNRATPSACWRTAPSCPSRTAPPPHANTFHFNYRWKNLRASMHYMEETFRVSDAQYTVQLRDVVFGLEQKLRLGKTVELNWRLGHADQLPRVLHQFHGPRTAGIEHQQPTEQRPCGLVLPNPRPGWRCASACRGTDSTRNTSGTAPRRNS